MRILVIAVVLVLAALVLLFPPQTKADICPAPVYSAVYCIDLFCNGRVVVGSCTGTTSPSSCNPAGQQVVCCSYQYDSAAPGWPCGIYTLQNLGPSDALVRTYALGCDGNLGPRIQAIARR